jgi:hypothetical protein
MSGQQWGTIQSFGAAGGADIATDAAPTIAAPPVAARVFRQGAQPSPMNVGNSGKLAIFSLDGTSLAVEVWILDETGVGKWYLAGAATATSATGPALIQAFPGAQTFVRVVTNTGNVKQWAVGQT